MSHILYGAYGAGNLGDDLLLEAALQRYPDTKLIVCFGKPYVTTSVPVMHIEEFFHVAEEWLGEGTCLVFAGGGLFWSLEHISMLMRLAARSKLSGSKLIIDSIGTQGASYDPGTVADIFMFADEASVRDAASLQCLEQVGISIEKIRLVPDLVTTLDLPKAEHGPPATKPVIGINWGDARFYLDNAWREHVAFIFNRVLDEFEGKIELRYICQVRHTISLKDDCLITAEHLRIMTGNRITVADFPSSALALFDTYRQCNAVVALRFHALVIATMLDIPAMALVTDDLSKYASFARTNNLPAEKVDNHGYEIAPKIISFIRGIIRTTRLPA